MVACDFKASNLHSLRADTENGGKTIEKRQFAPAEKNGKKIVDINCPLVEIVNIRLTLPPRAHEQIVAVQCWTCEFEAAYG